MKAGGQRAKWLGGVVMAGLCFTFLLVSAAAVQATGQSPAVMKRAAFLRARVFIERSQWTAAEEELEPLARTWPDDADVLWLLGSAYRQDGKIAEAEAILAPLNQKFPRNVEVRRELGLLLYDQERNQEVIALIEPTVKDRNAAPPDLMLVLAGAYERSGRSAEAESLYQAVAARTYKDVATLLFIGDYYLDHDRLDWAAAYYRQALARDPKNYPAMKGLAVALTDTAPEEARQTLLAALPMDNRDYEVLYLLGESYNDASPATAQDYFQQALARLEADTATSYLRKTAQARIFYRLNRRDDAEKLYRTLMAQRPNDGDLRNNLAELLIEERRFDEALSVLGPRPTSK